MVSNTPIEAAQSDVELAIDDTDGEADDEAIKVPKRYAREIAARERLLARCPVDIYVSGVWDRYSWPYRLVQANEANRSGLKDTCETLIVDSVPTDLYFPVSDVLDAAHEMDADYVVMKDYPGEYDVTLDAHERFCSHYQRHECDSKIMAVATTPNIGRFRAQCRSYKRSFDKGLSVHAVAVGGLRDAKASIQARWFREARKVMGYDVPLHGLGVGTSPELISNIRKSIKEDPERPLVDSIDISTPESAVKNNKIPDKTWTQRRSPFPEGVDSTTVRSGFAEAIARMLAYELTPDCDDDVLNNRINDTLC